MATGVTSKHMMDRSLMIKFAVAMGIPCLIWLIPLSTVFTREIRLFLVVTAWMLIWAALEITDLLIPALLWPVLLILGNVCPATTAYSSWLSLVVPSCVGGMLIANVLEQIGLLKRVTFWIVKTCGGTFNKTMYALFFACLIISIITFAGACVVIAGLCYGMCKALNIAKKKEAVIIMMVGMLGASTVRMFIYYPLSVGTILGSTASFDPTFTFGIYDLVKYNIPVVLYCVFFVWLMLFLGKTKHSAVSGGKAYFEAEYAKMGPMSGAEKKGAALLALLMGMILASPIHHIDGMMLFVMVAALLYFPGISIGTAENIKSLPIGTLFFLATCMGIGGVCSSLGLTQVLSDAFTPLLSSLGTVGTLFGILTFGLIMNFAMTPLAMLAAFAGPLLAICNSIGLDPLIGIFTFNFATDMVFLPYEYVTFLIFFSFGMMTTGQFVKYQALKNLLFYVFFGVIIIPYWYLLGVL